MRHHCGHFSPFNIFGLKFHSRQNRIWTRSMRAANGLCEWNAFGIRITRFDVRFVGMRERIRFRIEHAFFESPLSWIDTGLKIPNNEKLDTAHRATSFFSDNDWTTTLTEKNHSKHIMVEWLQSAVFTWSRPWKKVKLTFRCCFSQAGSRSPSRSHSSSCSI